MATPPGGKVLIALKTLGSGSHTVKEISVAAGVTIVGVYKGLERAIQKGQVTKNGTGYIFKETGK